MSDTAPTPKAARPKRVRRNLWLDAETNRRINYGAEDLGINPGRYVEHAVAVFEGFELVRSAKSPRSEVTRSRTE